MRVSQAVAVSVFVGLALAQEVEFKTLDVSANEISDGQKPFVTQGAVSSRQVSASQTQSIDSIVRGVPGAYTQIDQSQGSVSVNVRGMSGLGRVDTMVDGVTQTFFGTSADGGGGRYHSGSSTSAFGALIDPNFLVGVDLSRGFSGGHSGNALMGSANFKTIGVSDLVASPSGFGFYGKYSYGTNGIGPSYMGSVAGKFEFEDKSGFFGALFGYSGKKIRQNYTTGSGRRMGDVIIDPEDPTNQLQTTQPEMLTQRQRSQLVKFEFDKEASEAVLSFRNYRNVVAGRKIKNHNAQLNYKFDPTSELVSLTLIAAYNLGKQLFQEDASVFSSAAAEGARTKNKALSLDLNNQFDYKIASGEAASTLGVNYLQNKYQRKSKIDNTEQGASTPFSPNGEQKLATIYLNNNFQYDDLSVDLNANVLRYRLSGFRGECQTCIPSNATNIDKSGTKFNYEAVLGYKLSELFTPFVTYSQTHRVPTVQEMFFSNDGGNGVNPALKPERAKTWQVGFNAFGHNLVKNDVFGLKVLYYHTKVKNYIYNDNFYLTDASGNGYSFILHLNNPDETTFHGVEAELSYDAGFFYLNASYTRQHTAQPTSYTFTGQGSFGLSAISELPKDYANLNFGTRLFGERLELGAIVKYTGEATMIDPRDVEGVGKGEANWDTSFENMQEGARYTTKVPKIPTIVDLYAFYKTPVKGLNVKFEVQNLFDKDYYDALSRYNDAQTSGYYSNELGKDIILYNNAARGRTYYLSFEYRL